MKSALYACIELYYNFVIPFIICILINLFNIFMYEIPFLYNASIQSGKRYMKIDYHYFHYYYAVQITDLV